MTLLHSKTMIAYKVCLAAEGKFFSANCLPDAAGRLESIRQYPQVFKEYSIGETCTCDPSFYEAGFGLAVFMSYYGARAFYDRCDKFKYSILLVEVEGALPRLVRRFYKATDSVAYIECTKNSCTGKPVEGWPEDTLLVKTITPIVKLR